MTAGSSSGPCPGVHLRRVEQGLGDQVAQRLVRLVCHGTQQFCFSAALSASSSPGSGGFISGLASTILMTFFSVASRLAERDDHALTLRVWQDGNLPGVCRRDNK